VILILLELLIVHLYKCRSFSSLWSNFWSFLPTSFYFWNF